MTGRSREHERVLEAQRIVEHDQALAVAKAAYRSVADEGPTVVVQTIISAYQAERARLRQARELTFDLMWARTPDWAKLIAQDVARIRKIPVYAMYLKYRLNDHFTRSEHAAARHHLWSRIRSKNDRAPPSFPRIAGWFGVDHTTIMMGVRAYRARKPDAPDHAEMSEKHERRRATQRARYRRLKGLAA